MKATIITDCLLGNYCDPILTLACNISLHLKKSSDYNLQIKGCVWKNIKHALYPTFYKNP